MIAWSISAALESGLFDRVMVSTDDHEIADISRAAGAEVPFLRPAELSDDHAGTGPVIAHAISWQNANGEQTKEVCCIYATAPFIQVEDLKRGLDILQDSKADFAFSVTSFAAPIQRALRIRADYRMEMFDPEQFLTRSQDLEQAWHDAAQFYWGHAGAWLEGKPLFGPNAAPVTLPRHRVQDIDTLEDWERAEQILQVQRLV